MKGWLRMIQVHQIPENLLGIYRIGHDLFQLRWQILYFFMQAYEK